MGAALLVYRYLLGNVLITYFSSVAYLIYCIGSSKSPIYIEPIETEPSSCRNPWYAEHKYMEVNKIKLHYVDTGNSSKPLMLFLHGFPEFWYAWRYQLPHFMKNYRCVAVDMRGFGDSEKPEGISSYKLDIIVKDIRELILQLGYKKITLISHDWGATVACKFRDLHPDILNALVVLSGTSAEVLTEEMWTNPIQTMRSSYVFLYQTNIAESLLTLNNMSAIETSLPINGSVTQQDIDCYKYWFGKPSGFTPPLNYYRANFEYTVTKKVHTEKVPFLLVHGSEEAYFEKTILVKMKETYKYIETGIVDGVGHYMQEQNPTIVNELIDEFLARQKS